jgi:SAM-dependent methyltransferase
MSIVDTERRTYEDAWSLPAYSQHAPGEAYLPIALDLIGPARGTVLDAGCGSGKGALALRAAGFDVRMVDLTPAGLVPEAQALPFTEAALWSDLAAQIGQTDWVYCCDVMEHVPPAFTMLVAARLLAVARQGVFFSISLVPDSFGAWVGTPLHQTVQPFTWWRDHLGALGHVRECRDLLNAGVYLVEPRC